MSQTENVKQSRNYPALYWGGACYFMSVDKALMTKYNTNLLEVIHKYQQNGRLNDENLLEVIASLDRISNSAVFSDRLGMFSSKNGNEIVKTINYMSY